MGQGSYVMLGWGCELSESPESDALEDPDGLMILGSEDGPCIAIVPIVVSDPVVAKRLDCLAFTDTPPLDVAALSEDGMVTDAVGIWDELRERFPSLPEGRLLLVTDYD